MAGMDTASPILRYHVRRQLVTRQEHQVAVYRSHTKRPLNRVPTFSITRSSFIATPYAHSKVSHSHTVLDSLASVNTNPSQHVSLRTASGHQRLDAAYRLQCHNTASWLQHHAAPRSQALHHSDLPNVAGTSHLPPLTSRKCPLRRHLRHHLARPDIPRHPPPYLGFHGWHDWRHTSRNSWIHCSDHDAQQPLH